MLWGGGGEVLAKKAQKEIFKFYEKSMRVVFLIFWMTFFWEKNHVKLGLKIKMCENRPNIKRFIKFYEQLKLRFFLFFFLYKVTLAYFGPQGAQDEVFQALSKINAWRFPDFFMKLQNELKMRFFKLYETSVHEFFLFFCMRSQQHQGLKLTKMNFLGKILYWVLWQKGALTFYLFTKRSRKFFYQRSYDQH